MDLRLSLQELAAQYQLSKASTDRLNELAGIGVEPQGLQRSVPLGMAILAAALGGMGVIFWVAANWESLSRAGRFALLQALIVAMCTGAIFRPAARPALGLLAWLGIGGLFAYFGQTYQTGADPWQLFAIWAALSLPLCLGVRHDALWAPWALVCISAIALWIHAHAGHAWDINRANLGHHLAAWSAALLLVFALSPGLSRYTGAGIWGMRVAVTLTTFIITWSGLFGLFDHDVAPQYILGLAVLAGAATALCTSRFHDIFALSAIALGVNVLLVGGMVHLLFDKPSRGDPIFQTMLIGLVAAGLLAGTVKLVVGVARKHAQGAPA